MLSGAEAINLNVSVRNLTLVGGELDGVYKCRETLTLKLNFQSERGPTRGILVYRVLKLCSTVRPN